MVFPLENPGFVFLLFHLRVGVRLATKTLAPVFAIVFVSFYLFRIEFFILLARAVFVDSQFLVSGLVYSFIAIGTARFVAPRVVLGLNGWIRHLPIKSRSVRRLTVFSICIAQIPVLLALSVPCWLLSLNLGLNPAVYLVGLPFLGVASAFFVIQVKHRGVVQPLAFISCVLTASGSWPLVVSGILLLILCDAVSGPLMVSKGRIRFRKTFKGYGLSFFIAWRALGMRIVWPYFLALAVLGLTRVFLLNNDPGPLLTDRIFLFGGAVGSVILSAFVSHGLTVRRPPWPWSRSLPWTSRKRILIDSGFLGLFISPLFFLIGVMNFRIVWPLLLSLPALLVYSSLAIRQAQNCRTGAYGKISAYGIIGSLILCLIPWICPIFFVLFFILMKYAVYLERSFKVSRWLERHHLAAGDTLSWSQK
jgi:hypothetical protein